MSLFEDERYFWRETYFVLFDKTRCPLFVDVRRNFDLHVGSFSVLSERVGFAGELGSITLASYEDHVGIEIEYDEGDLVVAESEALLATMSKDCLPADLELFRRAKNYSARYTVLHFEQVAGTGEFKVVKKPELHFAAPLDRAMDRAAVSGVGRGKSIFTKRPAFCFDPTSYQKCRFGNGQVELPMDDYVEGERIDPHTLILVLEVLCKMTHGIAIDPASGFAVS
jgi:hypothetical protein